jgi:hypothetical protein
VQDPSQNIVMGQSGIRQSQIEAGNRTAIHLIVLTVPAMRLDDSGFVTVGLRVRSRATECFGPIRGESFHMLGMEAMAERVGHDLVGHHPLVPSVSKTAQAVVPTRCREDGLHSSMLTSDGFWHVRGQCVIWRFFDKSERGRCRLITGLGAVVLRYWAAWPRRGRIHWSIVYEKSVNAGTKRQEWLICIEPFPDI